MMEVTGFPCIRTTYLGPGITDTEKLPLRLWPRSAQPNIHERGEAVIAITARHPAPESQPALHDRGFFAVALLPHLVVHEHGTVPRALASKGHIEDERGEIVVVERSAR